MRGMLVAISLFLPAHTAFAIGPASKENVAAIEEYLADARLVEKNIAKAYESWKENTRRTPPDSRTVAAFERKISELKRERDLFRDKAIHLTLRAYDILPVDGSGKLVYPQGGILVPGDFAGKKAHWIPVAGENIPRPTLDAKGKPYTIPKAKDPKTDREPIAFTPYDGVSTLFPGEPFQSPTDLALALYHEKVHFEQYITPGQGDVLSFSEREMKAWSAEMSAFGMLNLDPKELKNRKDNALAEIAKYRKRIEDERFWRNIPFGHYALKEPAYLAPRSEGEVEELAKRADELDGIVAAEIEEVRSKREAREDRKREEALRAEKERREAVGRESLGYLWAGAQSACRRGRIDRTAVNVPMVSDHAFYCENEPRTMSAEDTCAVRIYGMIMGQLCRGTSFAPEEINATLAALYGPKPGVAPPVVGVGPNPGPGAVEATPRGSRPALESLAARACSNPGGLTREDLSSFFWFPDRGLGPMADLPDSLQGCPRELFIELARRNMTAERWAGIDLDWLRSEAVRHSAPSSSDLDSGGDRERDRDGGGNRVGDGNGPARGQAGKIGRNGSWPR